MRAVKSHKCKWYTAHHCDVCALLVAENTVRFNALVCCSLTGMASMMNVCVNMAMLLYGSYSLMFLTTCL
jgi:hypothetical protein